MCALAVSLGGRGIWSAVQSSTPQSQSPMRHARAAGLLNDEQGLAVFNGLAVVHRDFLDGA